MYYKKDYYRKERKGKERKKGFITNFRMKKIELD